MVFANSFRWEVSLDSLQGLEALAEYDYVAIFDADFKPDADFLVCLVLYKTCQYQNHGCGSVNHVCTGNIVVSVTGSLSLHYVSLQTSVRGTISACLCMQLETVPYLIDNPEVGYVQARWIFANPDECYLTKVTLCHVV